MRLRFGPGPVFVFESIVAARRWQAYVMRSIFVAALLGCLAAAWSSIEEQSATIAVRGSLRELAWLGERIYSMVTGVQLTLILLAAPAATAGAICLDRARGSLMHMFVTDLSDSEIVLGKLAARLLPVAALVSSSVPVLALAGLLGGIIPEALVTLTVVSAAIALFSCSLALVLSVRASKAHEALMAVYAIDAVWLLSLPFWELSAATGLVRRPPVWFSDLNPYYLAYAPYVWPQSVSLGEVSLFLGVMIGLSLVFVIISIARLRAEVRPPRRRSAAWDARIAVARQLLISWWPTPRLDGNPVLWREWYRNRPTRMGRLVLIAYVTAVSMGMLLGIRGLMEHGITPGPDMLTLTNFLGVGFGLLLVASTAPTTLAEERARGSLDVLLSTPLSTTSIVLGKWLAVFLRSLPLLILPAISGLFISIASTDYPNYFVMRMRPAPLPIDTIDRVASGVLPLAFAFAHLAATTSVGLALGTWIKRPGRAVAASVACYVFAAIGWIFVVEVAGTQMTRWLAETIRSWGAVAGNAWNDPMLMNLAQQILIAPTPLGSQVMPFEVLTTMSATGYRKVLWFLLSVEVLGLLGLAVLILGLTLLTFNLCLGRVEERARPPRGPRRVEPLFESGGEQDEVVLDAAGSSGGTNPV